jgi:hypothetical protein
MAVHDKDDMAVHDKDDMAVHDKDDMAVHDKDDMAVQKLKESNKSIKVDSATKLPILYQVCQRHWTASIAADTIN